MIGMDAMYSELYRKLSDACCCITVFIDEEKISEGTGFAFRRDGQVITAAHVVTGRVPIRDDDFSDPDVRVYAKFPRRELLEYRTAFRGITIMVKGFSSPIQIDQAILVPKDGVFTDFPFLPAQTKPPQLGEEVFCAGYSDEIEVPFRVNRILENGIKGREEFLRAMKMGYLADMTGPLIKRAVIGNICRVVAESSTQGISLQCDVFYADCAMHSGASGGPVVNAQGEAVGIITKRAVTSVSQSDASNLSVPSGATVGVSFQALDAACKHVAIHGAQHLC